jgi:hypothetical protein
MKSLGLPPSQGLSENIRCRSFDTMLTYEQLYDQRRYCHYIERHRPVSMRKGASLFLLSVSIMASSSSEKADAFAASSEGNDLPRLPPPKPGSNLPTIRLGETISFEEMGPIILNTDGTTRRIENWDTLTKNEQEVTWRRISQRNEIRRQALLKQQQQNDEDEAKDL